VGRRAAALPTFGAFTILMLRLLLGAIALMPFAWPQGYRLRLSLHRTFVLFGLTGMVLHLGLGTVGLRFTSASSANLIIATLPVVSAAFLHRLSQGEGDDPASDWHRPVDHWGDGDHGDKNAGGLPAVVVGQPACARGRGEVGDIHRPGKEDGARPLMARVDDRGDVCRRPALGPAGGRRSGP